MLKAFFGQPQIDKKSLQVKHDSDLLKKNIFFFENYHFNGRNWLNAPQG